MPQPARIADPTNKLVAPEDWNEAEQGQCGTLFIRREVVNGVPYLRSAWDFTPNEALLLLSGAKVLLGLALPVHPVVHLMVDQLDPDFEPSFTVRKITSSGGMPLAHVDGLYHSPVAGPQRVYVEEPIVEGGMALAVGRAIDKIEDLARKNGWIK